MFTGLIRELGLIRGIRPESSGAVLSIGAEIADTLSRGASVNINGACQTVIAKSGKTFEVFATAETLQRTNFVYLRVGDRVNLEPPLSLDSPLGGHLVLGHIDGPGRIVDFIREGQAAVITIGFAPEYGRYLVEKGSVAVDGISLTCYDITVDTFRAALIPETIENTNLRYRQPGQIVNLEFDLLAKYVEKMTVPKRNAIDWEFLREHGFER